MPSSLTPSIRAAFMMSTGKFREFCRNIMIMKGVATAGSMKPQTLLRSFILLIIVNSGIMVATFGIIIASSRTPNSASLALS